MICPVCGAFSPDDSQVCSHCATPFAQEPVIAPIEVPTAEIMPEPVPVPVAPKKGRIWVPFVVLACMVATGLTLFLLTGNAKPAISSDMPWFSIQDGVLSFDASLYSGSSELTVPSTVAGQTVTALRPGCFLDCDTLTTVILPNTLKTISSGAFQDCDALRGIFIPESVKTIGASAFAGCDALEAICILHTVTEIGDQAFSGCVKLSFVFYSGSGSSWRELYQGEISLRTYIIAGDETFIHPRPDPQ